jgi:sugar lactone lactonase YvrE
MNSLYPSSQSPATFKVTSMPRTQVQPATAMAVVPRGVTPKAIGPLIYSQVPGAATSLAVAPDGSLWALSTAPTGSNKYIWHYANGTWTNIPGLASSIAVAPNGTLYAVNSSSGGLYAYSAGTWSALGGGSSWVTTGADGAVYVISNGNVVNGNAAIWKFLNGTWTQQPGVGAQLAGSFDSQTYSVAGVGTVAPNGFFVLNSTGGIYYYSPGSGYVKFTGAASSVAPISGGVFALGYPTSPNGEQLFYFDYGTATWTAQAGTGASLAAGVGTGGTGSQLYIVGSTNAIFTTQVGTQALWIANGTNVLEFLPIQLLPGVSDPAPHIVLNTAAGFVAPQGVQFGANGDLWVLDGGNAVANGSAALYEFTPAQLAAHATTPNPVPNKKITYPGITFPQQGVFDKNGDFWVADNGANEVVEFTPAQLAAGGNLTPTLTLTSTIPFTGPLGIAFSPITGNLWVANNGGTSIEGFAAASLAGLTGAQTLAPHDVLNDDGQGSIQAPWALVFDKSGNLWSSNANTPFTIVEFAAGGLGGGLGATPVPNITISPVNDGGNTTLNAPNGLAFDSLGNLSAISSAAPFGVPVYAASQLGASGATVPNVFLVGATTTLNAPAGDVFGPAVP